MNGNNAAKHGGNLYAAIRQRGGNINELLDFSANINPLGLAESVRQTLHASLEAVIHYPDAQAHALRQALCQHYHIDEDMITIGNGAVELMYILCHMLHPKKVLVTAPTFSEYESAARSSGAAIEYFYLQADDDFKIDLKAITEQLAGIDIVFICNPNNPTGTLLTNKELEKLIMAAKQQNTYIVVDESFIDFLPIDDVYSCRQLLPQYSNLIIVHSLTKFYAIPGLRLGFSLANPDITELLHAGKDPWNVNTLAQNAGVVALHDHSYQEKSKEFINKVNQDFYHSLLTIPGLKPYVPSANFILINLKETNMTSKELQTALIAHNILIRDCSNYPGLSSQYIRIAVKTPVQNNQLIEALKKFLGGTI